MILFLAQCGGYYDGSRVGCIGTDKSDNYFVVYGVWR